MKKSFLFFLFLLTIPTAFAFYSGETFLIKDFDNCYHNMDIIVTASLPIEKGEYNLINFTQDNDTWFANCTGTKQLYMETLPNAINNYTLNISYYSKIIESSGGGGGGSSKIIEIINLSDDEENRPPQIISIGDNQPKEDNTNDNMGGGGGSPLPTNPKTKEPIPAKFYGWIILGIFFIIGLSILLVYKIIQYRRKKLEESKIIKSIKKGDE